MSWQPFNASNKPGTCKWCGRKLRRPVKDTKRWNRETRSFDVIPKAEREYRYSKPGNYGDGHFCGLNCGYQFGRACANNGKMLQPPTNGR